MTKHEFENGLRERLKTRGLSDTEITKSIDFYLEMIDDRVEEGMSEEEAVAALGDIDDIARQILYDAPLGVLVKSKIKSNKKERSAGGIALLIVLLIFGFPLWFPIVAALFGVAVAICAVLFALIVTVIAVFLSVIVAGLALIPFAFFALTEGVGAAIWVLSGALILLGVAILLWFPVKGIFVGIVKLMGAILRGIKSLFIGKKEKN